MPYLTLRRLCAIEEALSARLAGELEDGLESTPDDYAAAWEWVYEQISRKKANITSTRIFE